MRRTGPISSPAERLVFLRQRSRDTRATRRATCPQAGASERAGYGASLGTKPDPCVIRTLRHRQNHPRPRCLRVCRRPEFLLLHPNEGPGEKRVRLPGGAALDLSTETSRVPLCSKPGMSPFSMGAHDEFAQGRGLDGLREVEVEAAFA